MQYDQLISNEYDVQKWYDQCELYVNKTFVIAIFLNRLTSFKERTIKYQKPKVKGWTKKY